MGVYRNS